MALSDRQLEEIGSYVKSHLPEWLAEMAPDRRPLTITDPAPSERIVRVEESLSRQRELMSRGFAAMDKRFQEMRTDMDVRFRTTNRMIVAFFALVTVDSAVVQFV